MTYTAPETLALGNVLMQSMKPMMDAAKGQQEDELLELHDKFGVKNAEIAIGDDVIGSRYIKGGETIRKIAVEDNARLMEELISSGLVVPAPGWEKFFPVAEDGTVFNSITGEVADYLTSYEETTPIRAVVSINKKKAAEAVSKHFLDAPVSAFLEGGN